MKIIRAPERIEIEGQSIYLAGSIGVENWQRKIIKLLDNYNIPFLDNYDLPITILNPRRDDWDSSWIQSIKNPQFKEQVEWELRAQEKADCILMYFDPKTKPPITLLELGLSKSPITLLELGLFAHFQKLLVCCPDGFWRKENVDIVCRKYNIEQFDSIKDLAQAGIQYLIGGKNENKM